MFRFVMFISVSDSNAQAYRSGVLWKRVQIMHERKNTYLLVFLGPLQRTMQVYKRSHVASVYDFNPSRIQLK